MEILHEAYMKSIIENERNCKYWDHYLQSLKSLDLPYMSEKLKVPVLVPIGSRIVFRGELKHTSEVIISLGADYFVKCSAKEAEIIRQHRIKVAQEKLDAYAKEREFILNQMSFKKGLDEGQNIIEHESEEEYKAWKEEHEANVRAYKQKEKECSSPEEAMTDNDIFNILEKLEVREELMKEFNMAYDTTSSVTLQDAIPFTNMDQNEETAVKVEAEQCTSEEVSKKKKVTFGKQMSMQTSTYDLLQQIMISQGELEEKLNLIKSRGWGQCNTEEDLVAKLDAQEELEEIEDDINRLDDLVPYENDLEESETESDQADSTKSDTSSFQRRVSFVDECECSTEHITFRHSQIEPSDEPYDPDRGIQKPSDIYKAYSNLFDSGTVSILKKSKCTVQDESVKSDKKTSIREKVQDKKVQIDAKTVSQNQSEAIVQTKTPIHLDFENKVETRKDVVEQMGQDHKNLQTSITKRLELEDTNKQTMDTCQINFANEESTSDEPTALHKTNSEHNIPVDKAVLKEVVEKNDQENKKSNSVTKRLSLFKKRRMQNKLLK